MQAATCGKRLRTLLWVSPPILYVVSGVVYVVLNGIGGVGWMSACERNDTAYKRWFLSLPVKPDFLTVQGTTPLYWAVRNGDIASTRVLLGRGASPFGGRGALRFLQKQNPQLYDAMRLELLPYLKRQAKDPEKRELLLRLSMDLRDFETATWCFNQGADINAPLVDGTHTFLQSAVSEGQAEGLIKARYLLEQGADVNLLGNDGRNTLTIAAVNQDNKMIALLKAHGATR